MPRTKISKSSKRNRETSQREQKICDYEKLVDELIVSLDKWGRNSIETVDTQVKLLKRRINKNLMTMKMRDFMELNLSKFGDWRPTIVAQDSSSSIASQSICGSNVLVPPKSSNPNDEGYLTEDSSTGGSRIGSLAILTNMTQVQQQQRGRTPGPLSSAKARRPRRSKSFCGDFVQGSIIGPSQSTQASERASRNKMRTPLVSRTKAFSADRQSKIRPSSPSSPASAFLRWPKPGELVMSISGSPVVAQVMPDKFANVNIPVRNGVLSLRPKKISELKPDILEALDQETLNQIKTLHENLNLIMSLADKTGLN